MRKTLSLITLLFCALSSCQPVYAGYSVYASPQIPEFVTCNGPYGPEQCPNTAAAVLPATFGAEICRPDNYSLYVADPGRRTRVFSDGSGSATAAEVLAACPALRASIIVRIKDIRKQALAQLTIDSGVSAVYAENYAAATAYKNGAGAATTMKDGQTAANYLTGLGAQLGMSAGQFADYIINENRRIGPTAYEAEREYLRLVYTVIPLETNIDRLLAYPDTYRRFCGL